jgi:hypothetical protein
MDGRSFLFSLICKFLGLVFTPSTHEACMKNPDIFEYQRPFDETDLVDIQERIKHMNIVIHGEGFVLKMKALRKTKDEARRLYLLAIESFKKALESDPNNKNSLRNLADCLMQIGKTSFLRF